MASLTTHVLDLSSGKPAAGMTVELWRESKLITTTATNADGRCEQALLAGDAFASGSYELRFFVREYFEAAGTDCPFLDVVPLAFSVAGNESYHVPLLCSPWSYSTYRGS